jgi:hypothetical protein
MSSPAVIKAFVPASPKFLFIYFTKPLSTNELTILRGSRIKKQHVVFTESHPK